MAQEAQRVNKRDMELLIKRINKKKDDESYITVLSWEKPFTFELEEKNIYKFWTYKELKRWLYSLSVEK